MNIGEGTVKIVKVKYCHTCDQEIRGTLCSRGCEDDARDLSSRIVVMRTFERTDKLLEEVVVD